MSWIIIIFKWIIPIGICLFIVDRFLLWVESHGWIYYRRKKASPGSFSTAFLEVHSILEPSKKATINELRKTKHEEEHAGDPVNEDDKPEPGAQIE